VLIGEYVVDNWWQAVAVQVQSLQMVQRFEFVTIQIQDPVAAQVQLDEVAQIIVELSIDARQLTVATLQHVQTLLTIVRDWKAITRFVWLYLPLCLGTDPAVIRLMDCRSGREFVISPAGKTVLEQFLLMNCQLDLMMLSSARTS
jgi:hypothetical protein